MGWKYAWRTFRNVVSRTCPYFAHLAITHRCNLRCRFCHIQEEHFDELDFEGMKHVIDILDQMGIAVLSISGGGEPLLRHDFAAIINYAAGKGMYTKITSNGTMPLDRYRELLRSAVSEVGISLDGVTGNDLPHSHVGPKILQTIRYLNDHLPRGKHLTLNVTISQANRDQVEEIIEYCTHEFLNARIWLNPVVVGDGKLRTDKVGKANPEYLRRVDSPTLLKASFYTRGVDEQYRNDKFNWGCLAGQFSFDIKPNGDFWICQDHPAHVGLNILDSDFLKKYRESDFSYRRDCSGCTYSCYFVTQKVFEPANWPDLARIWWKTVTAPGEPCRDVARKYGWLAGLAYFCTLRKMQAAKGAVASLIILLSLASLLPLLRGQQAVPPINADRVVAKMEEANQARQAALLSYHSQRRYEAANPRFGQRADALVYIQYVAPGAKTFRMLETNGSSVILKRVIEPLLESEQQTTGQHQRKEVDISRLNYVFTLAGLDEKNGMYIFAVEPHTPNKYLFRGRIWVDPGSFGIARIDGEPAISPSFWVKKTHFVHQYARFGDFWFPVSHRTEVELRVFGKSTLSIDYYGYEWRPAPETGRTIPGISFCSDCGLIFEAVPTPPLSGSSVPGIALGLNPHYSWRFVASARSRSFMNNAG
jgi:MoaA/NifB/PqqE/SkfB family radical SAM enzyme